MRKENLFKKIFCPTFVASTTLLILLTNSAFIKPALACYYDRSKSVENTTHPGATTDTNPAVPGDTLKFTLTTYNYKMSENLIIKDDLSTLLNYTSNPFDISHSGSFDGGINKITWHLNIPDGGTVSVSFKVTISENINWPESGKIYIINTYGNEIQVPVENPSGGPEEPEPEPEPETEPEPAVEPTGEPKLTISKGNNASHSVSAGETIKYTIVIKNEGDAVAKDIVLVDTLPAGFSYKPGTSRLNNNPMSDPGGSNPYTWGLGELAEGNEFKLEYEAEISVNSESGIYENTAQVSGKIAHSEVAVAEKIIAASTVKEELPVTGAKGDKRILAAIAILLAAAALLLRYYIGDFSKTKKED